MASAEHRPGKNYRIGSIRGMGSFISEFVRAVKFLAAHVGVKVESDDITSATATLDGIRARFNATGTGGGGGTTHPFLCSSTTNGTDPITVVPGDVNEFTAGSLTPTVSDTGTQYVYIDITLSLDVTSNNYVTGLTISAVNIATGSSVPAHSSTHCYIPVATYVDGVKTVQSRISSMFLGVRDDGTGTGTPSYIYVQA